MIRALAAALVLAAPAALAQGVTDSQVVLGQSVALTGPAQQLEVRRPDDHLEGPEIRQVMVIPR
jgi:hypothetical protein